VQRAEVRGQRAEGRRDFGFRDLGIEGLRAKGGRRMAPRLNTRRVPGSTGQGLRPALFGSQLQ